MLSDVIDVMEAHRDQIGEEIRSALMQQSFVGMCPDCGGELRVKRSKKGEFISCANYPECKRAYPKPRGAKVEPTEETCPNCRSPVVRVVRRGSPPQKQCLDPECEVNKQATSVGVCPECGQALRLLYSRAGKRFLGCSGYPDCKRTYPLPQFGTLRMTGEVCDACQAPIALVMNKGRPWKLCVNMDCPKREKKEASGKTAPAKKKATRAPTAEVAPAKKGKSPSREAEASKRPTAKAKIKAQSGAKAKAPASQAASRKKAQSGA
jgi:DNA topoisomerase-1